MSGSGGRAVTSRGGGRAAAALLVLLLYGCDRPPEEPPRGDVAADSVAAAPATDREDDDHWMPPVDTLASLPPRNGDGWGYVRSAAADLDGDGEQERVVVAARVEVRRGEPLWDDGQDWAVFVEEVDGQRTPILLRFVQLGHVEALLTEAGEAPPAVLAVERTPHSLSVYEAVYRGPGDVSTRPLLRRALSGAAASVDVTFPGGGPP